MSNKRNVPECASQNDRTIRDTKKELRVLGGKKEKRKTDTTRGVDSFARFLYRESSLMTHKANWTNSHGNDERFPMPKTAGTNVDARKIPKYDGKEDAMSSITDASANRNRETALPFQSPPAKPDNVAGTIVQFTQWRVPADQWRENKQTVT